MTISVGNGGSYKEALSGTSGTGTAVGAGGAYKSISDGWIGEGGVWKRIFQSFILSLSANINCVAVGSTSAVSSLTLALNGSLATDDPGGGTGYGTPLINGIGFQFEARLTKISGDDPTFGPALGVWHTISTERQWQLFTNTTTKTFNGTLDIGNVGTSTAIVSAPVFMTSVLP